MNKHERNKNAVAAFYDLMFNQNKPREAIDRYAGTEYIQHNPHVPDGKEAFIRYFEEKAKTYPEKRVEFRRIITEGDFVVVHCFQDWATDDERYWASIDIFRLDEEGKIVEHWDVIQPVPDKSANENTMF